MSAPCCVVVGLEDMLGVPSQPDPANPKIVNAGTGSLPEMIEFLDEEKVSYGLVRMGFGSGQWKRVK